MSESSTSRARILKFSANKKGIILVIVMNVEAWKEIGEPMSGYLTLRKSTWIKDA